MGYDRIHGHRGHPENKDKTMNTETFAAATAAAASATFIRIGTSASNGYRVIVDGVDLGRVYKTTVRGHSAWRLGGEPNPFASRAEAARAAILRAG